jgi:predicted AlkP superfamily phosphohydrolase/phosphomutase
MLSPGEIADETATLLQTADDVETLPALDGVEERHKAPARIDQLYERLNQRLTAVHPVQVSLMRFQSPDQIGHYFLRYAVPSRFGDVSDDDRRRYGGLLEAHYALVDEAIGRAIASLGPDDLLLVVSGYGMEPLTVSKRLLEQVIGDPEVSGSHEGAPDGFLIAYGASVVRAKQLRRASIVDVLPTILYFLGLPVARDMDGYARPDFFVNAFTEERPITFIPTYDK